MTVDEELDGQGDVFGPKDNEPIGRVTYHIVVWQEWTETGRGPQIKGHRDTNGRLDIDYGTAARWLGNRQTLHLADGRWLDFLVTNTSGEITGMGPLRNER